MELSIKRATISTKVCSFPSCGQRSDLHVIPLKTRQEILKHKRFYVTKLVKACSQHLDHKAWMSQRSIEGENTFTVAQIEDMVDLLRLDSKPENQMTSNVHFKFLTLFGVTKYCSYFQISKRTP